MSKFYEFVVFYLAIGSIIFNVSTRNTNKISDGTVVTNEKIARYIVSVRFGTLFTYFGHHCGGAILSARIILTAAHCVVDHRFEIAKHVWIIAGSLKSEKLPQQAQVHTISDIYMHPDYMENNFADLALLKTTSRINWNKFVAKVPLSEESPKPNAACVAVGWGSINVFGPLKLSDEILFVSQNIIMDIKNCPHFNEGLICAGDLNNENKSVQQGDSGGPLLCDGRLFGIVSQARGFQVYKYYVSVHYYKDWIAEYVDLSAAENFQFTRKLLILVLLISLSFI